MNNLWFGLQVAVVGMLVVFIGLIILIGCIKALKVVRREKESPPQAHSAPPDQPSAVQPQQPARTYVPGPLLTRKDDALYAVLAASIASTLASEGVNPEGGFVIRSIRALNEPVAGPALTPKDDAFYALLTATIAKVLEPEGINPEGGFAIRGVKAL